MRIEEGASTAKRVVLLSVGNVEHCNALAKGQTLEFAPKGITVVCGDNGSGKSGYARLFKTIVRARMHHQALTDIFRDDPSTDQGADVAIEIDGERVEFQWPDSVHAELEQVGFCDDASGDAFIARESEVDRHGSAAAQREFRVARSAFAMAIAIVALKSSLARGRGTARCSCAT